MHGHRPLLAGALLVSILVANTPSAASATAAPVVVGEVTSGGAGLDGATLGLFRKLVEREIGRLELDQGLRPEGFVFSASLVRLDAHATHGGAHASCVVAGALRRAGTGAIVALMHGSGSVDGERDALAVTRARALEVAVHGAVRRVPEAL
jgi:hypothetical protein